MDYDDFKHRWLFENFKESLNEQFYAENKLFWHVSKDKVEELKKRHYPFFISKRVDFFFKEKHDFDIRKNKRRFEWIYATKLRKTLNIFNPKNPKDANLGSAAVKDYLSTQSPETIARFNILWNEYLSTGYWQYIERDASSLRENELMTEVLSKLYDGFLVSSNTSYGSMGIFDATNVRILGEGITIERFLNIFDDKGEYKEPNFDGNKAIRILKQAEHQRTEAEVDLMKLMNYFPADYKKGDIAYAPGLPIDN